MLGPVLCVLSLSSCDAPPVTGVDSGSEALAVDEVTIADAWLDGLVRFLLDLPEGPLTPSDLEGLTALRTGGPVTDLTGLEEAVNLEDLRLGGLATPDLSPLSALTGLIHLELGGGLVSDLSSLAGLTLLEELILTGNQVVDLTPLAGLTSLRRLDLSENPVVDLSSLAALATLERLDLNRSETVDVGTLSGLAQLDALYLNGSGVRDVSGLSGLTGLSHLELEQNEIADVAPLAGLEGLDILLLMGNRIGDVSAFTGPTSPQVLTLTSNQISDLGALVTHGGLGHIGVGDNPLSEAALCDQVPALEAAGAFVRGAGACPTAGPVSESRLALDKDVYVVDLIDGFPLSWTMKLEYSNPTGSPFFIESCGDTARPDIERLVDGEWTTVYTALVTACLGWIEVPAGDSHRVDHSTIYLEEGDPEWQESLVEGTYRLVWDSVFDRAEEGAPELPLEQRVSDLFSLVPG